MLCYHMGGQLAGHILLLWQPAIVFLLLCYTVCYVCLANKLSLSLSLRRSGVHTPQHAVERDGVAIISASAHGRFVLDTALLQWINEYAVRAYTTADSAASYLNHARIA